MAILSVQLWEHAQVLSLHILYNGLYTKNLAIKSPLNCKFRTDSQATRKVLWFQISNGKHNKMN